MRVHASFAFYAFAAVALGLACSPSPLPDPEVESSGSSGTGATGGTMASGGVGNVGNVGNAPSGGTGNVAGTVGQGGSSGSAGTVAAGGTASGAAGTATSGGTAGTGTAGTGTAGTGTAGTGTAGTGTAGTATAGSGGSAGAPPVACDAAWTVGNDGFVKAPVAGGGCWHGYAFAGADATSMAMPTSFAMCGAGCVLQFSGSVAASATFSGTAYLGFNVGQAANGTSGTVVPAGTGLTVNFTNTGGSPLRVQIQGPTGDTVATDRWCADLVGAAGPVTVPYTTFNTMCWDNSGTAYAKQPIKAIQLVIPGSDTAAVPFNVTLTSVTE
jgi:hypothetical protein